MLLIPVVVVTVVFRGVGLVTGPVTLVPAEISPAAPTTSVLDAPLVESVNVTRIVLVACPRQLYATVTGVLEGFTLVVEGGTEYRRVMLVGRTIARAVVVPVPEKSRFTV
jgi:hypothetical protein